MTIIHLITSLGGGGTENFLYQILSGTPPGIQHQVFYLGKDGVNGNRIRALGIPVTRVSSLIGFYRLLKRERPTMLHTCLFWGHQVGRVLGRAAKLPLIVSSQQSIDVWQKPWHGWMDRWTLPFCHILDVNSDAARRVIEERLGSATPRPTFAKVENGVDFSRFTPRDREAARRALGLPLEAVIGGTLMRLHPEKGAEKIPAFARQLLNKHPTLHLVIGGVGPLQADLQSQTQDLHPRLHWAGWQDDTVQFLSALDFFWLLSREESFPQALLEASAMGLPWVAPQVGGISELRDAGAAGLLAPSNDVASLTKSAGELLANLSTQREHALQAVATLKTRYSERVMTDAFYRLLPDLENNL